MIKHSNNQKKPRFSKIPGWLASIAPASALKIEEKSWNGFPHVKTELTVHKRFYIFLILN